MKKTYIEPKNTVVQIKLETMIAQSIVQLGGEYDGSATIQGRESIWDEEEEWDNFEYK